jgi:hypothetical protein
MVIRNIPQGSTNALTFEDIHEGNSMINFPRNTARSEYNYKQYYKNTPQTRSLTKNPFTRRALRTTNFQPYTARLVQVAEREALREAHREAARREKQREALREAHREAFRREKHREAFRREKQREAVREMARRLAEERETARRLMEEREVTAQRNTRRMEREATAQCIRARAEERTEREARTLRNSRRVKEEQDERARLLEQALQTNVEMVERATANERARLLFRDQDPLQILFGHRPLPGHPAPIRRTRKHRNRKQGRCTF